MAQTRPKSAELIPALAEMYESNQINEFMIKRAKVEADKLLNKGMIEGHVLHAIVYCLLLDLDSYLPHLKIVEEHAIEATHLMNMVKCQLRFGFNHEAFMLSQSLAKQFPDDIEVLKLSLDTSIQAARFASFITYFDKLQKLGHEGFSKEDFKVVDLVNPVLSLMKETNINEADLGDVVNLSSSIIRNSKIAFRGVAIECGREGNLAFGYTVATSVKNAVDLSFDIAENIATNLDRSFYEILTISCIPDAV
jgi:hypothetical protein